MTSYGKGKKLGGITLKMIKIGDFYDNFNVITVSGFIFGTKSLMDSTFYQYFIPNLLFTLQTFYHLRKMDLL